ncbi:regulatory protein, luxR family [Streptomyces sp. 1222.2]|uniref:Two-component system response regulator DesR n=2 Tax=Streptomyces stelliscabiei TaxID=146820 RepID=A0A8I0PAL3_9ACTN|nr:two-component system response regulator DesR [Streptomyces stelliscabiei]SOD68433.1 regulatory protein, luxR family [Streptomyces sp. 1222.2]
MYSTLTSELKLSAAALSSADPTRPMDCTTPSRSQSLLYASDVYSALWKIVAAKLHLSESTVRNHLSSAIGKTGTRNRMEAMREARQQGWL